MRWALAFAPVAGVDDAGFGHVLLDQRDVAYPGHETRYRACGTQSGAHTLEGWGRIREPCRPHTEAERPVLHLWH